MNLNTTISWFKPVTRVYQNKNPKKKTLIDNTDQDFQSDKGIVQNALLLNPEDQLTEIMNDFPSSLHAASKQLFSLPIDEYPIVKEDYVEDLYQ
jgi:hypothetical protein